ncbi:hypothetical protein AAIR98_000629 [Elusimicrobium simillimum]|uniref:ATP-binding protein n=1 Tax=Elusimicrobium simillimum TaxID=3143438 RepID=UPI003C6F3EC8
MKRLEKEAILKIGEVYEVEGRRVFVEVSKKKNSSDIFFDGEIIKNVAVNSFIEIRKGFLSIIGKIEGERIENTSYINQNGKEYELLDKNKRVLIVSLFGYIGKDKKFIGGTKELPLVGNEAYILTREKLLLIHSFLKPGEASILIAKSDSDDLPVDIPIDGLFNTHIAIFGNTGSGKSNTLASLYQALTTSLATKNYDDFTGNTRFALFDFNGEYKKPNCIIHTKKVYNLSTRNEAGGDKIPILEKDILDLELLSILSDATDKTQKPFLARAIKFIGSVLAEENSRQNAYFQNILKKDLKQILLMSDKVKIDLLLDYFDSIYTSFGINISDARRELYWHAGNNNSYYVNNTKGERVYFNGHPEAIDSSSLYLQINNLLFNNMDIVQKVIIFLYIQLIRDLLDGRVQNEHIYPVINRFRRHYQGLVKIFSFTNVNVWGDSNFIVFNLNDVNLDMKKILPLLLSKKLYSEHKKESNSKSLTLIIDEAHNILSKESVRETESWKDYRLETFEEIIKEGRKFGVFLTIASQRPNDISETIISQAHNYFIHRLVNQKDLMMIENAVSYIDRITKESIPTLPIGTCIFSGTATQLPIKLNISELTDDKKPESNTLQYKTLVKERPK